ncbi:MAG: hypothetical protein AAF598_02035 [Bacteroidota bacterium]
MKTKILMLCFLGLMIQDTIAQKNPSLSKESNASTSLTPSGAIVCDVVGKVRYFPSPTGKAQLLKPGVELSEEGKIRIIGNARIGICFKKYYGTIKNAGNYEVRNILTTQDFWETSTTAEVFSNAVKKAKIHDLFSPEGKTLLREGFTTTATTGTNTSGDKPPSKTERDGWGHKKGAILPIQPQSGKVYGSNIIFEWGIAKKTVGNAVGKEDSPFKKREGTLKNAVFILELKNRGEMIVHSQEVVGMRYVLDAPNNDIVPGKYSWQVRFKDEQNNVSTSKSFEYVGNRDTDDIMNTLSNESIYQQASPATKQLILAALSYHLDYQTAAGKNYADVFRTTKGNPLARILWKWYQYEYDLEDLPAFAD